MRRDLRLLPVAGSVWFVALLCVFVPSAAMWCAAGGAVSTVVLAGIAAGVRRWRRSSLGLLIVVAAISGAVGAAVVVAAPGRSDAAAWHGRVVEASGMVSSSASLGQDGRLWLDVELTAIGPPGAPRPASAPIRIGIDPADGFDLGASVRVTGEAVMTDPGERAALVVFATSASIDHPASGVFAWAAGLRTAFIDRATALPEPGAGLLPGLAVGDTRAVSPELNDAMRASGLSHLTAVSGANCAIVVGAVFWLAAICGAARWLRVVVAAVALSGFVVLVTPEPSVIRASVMAGLAMAALLLGRPSAGTGLLASSAIGILVVDPWLAATPGFALSVAASGALILLAPALARGLARGMPSPLALALAVPTAPQLACGPIIALFSEQQSLVGIAANLLAAPAAPVATVIGLLACLAAHVPPAADLLAATAWLPAAWIAMTATVSADLPVAQIALPAGSAGAILVAAVSASIGVVLVGARVVRPVRVVAGGVVAVVSALGVAQALVGGPLASATSPDGWSIAVCDVGQGDAVVVRSGDEVALIDTGPEVEPLQGCLASLGIDRVDLLVLTHFDLDHVGGVDAVRGRVDVVMHGPPGSAADERLLADLAESGATLADGVAGTRGELGDAAWEVVWPVRGSSAFPAGNDQSVVIAMEGGGVPRSLFLGDLSAEAQRMMMRVARLHGTFPVVKVAHHGSADQDPGLYQDLRPAIALFSAGEDNDYGHPRAETLSLLASAGATVLRTDESGRILVSMRGGSLEIWTERTPP